MGYILWQDNRESRSVLCTVIAPTRVKIEAKNYVEAYIKSHIELR